MIYWLVHPQDAEALNNALLEPLEDAVHVFHRFSAKTGGDFSGRRKLQHFGLVLPREDNGAADCDSFPYGLDDGQREIIRRQSEDAIVVA
jgi:hypothetical protein